MYTCKHAGGLTWWPRSRSLSPLHWQHRWCRTDVSLPPLGRPSLSYRLWSSALDCLGCTVPGNTRRHRDHDNQSFPSPLLHCSNVFLMGDGTACWNLPVCGDTALLSHRGSPAGWCLWALYPAHTQWKEIDSQWMYKDGGKKNFQETTR